MKSRLSISLPANICYVFLSLGINFLLVPFIVDRLGSTAYGFHSISNDFTSYASIVTVALNYMGCRFIAFSYHRNEREEASRFFTSLLYGDVLLGIALSVVSFIVVLNLNHIIDIPETLITDVKITFSLTFAAFILQIAVNAYTAGIYVKDRMDLYAIKNMFYILIRAVIILILYSAFPARLYYVSLAVLIGMLFNVLFDLVCTKRMLPDIRVDSSHFDTACVKELLSSGGWSSFVSMGTVMSKGLDLVIANQMVDSYHMGLLAVSKTFIAAFDQLRQAVTNVFRPKMLQIYAVESKDRFILKVKQFMMLISAILYVPVAGITVFSWDLYRLWLPGYTEEECKLVTVLTLWGIVNCVMSVAVSCLPEVYATINRLKVPTLVNFFENLAAFGLTLFLLNQSSGNVIVIVAISAVINMIYQMSFGVSYCAVLLERPIWTFFPTVLKGLASYAILVVAYYGIHWVIAITSWGSFFAVITFCGILGYGIQYMFLVDREEKQAIKLKISGWLKERRNK